MKLTTVLAWAAAAFAVWYCIQQPAAPAHIASGIWNALQSAAGTLSKFASPA